MRAYAAAVALIAVAGLAFAGNAPTTREPTRIPREPLGTALRTLARARGFQLVYDSGQVDHQKTPGATGDLTVDEALTQILRGTGLTFQNVPDGGIVVEPIASEAHPGAPPSRRRSALPSALPAANGRSSAAEPAQLGRVMIEASKERQALRHQVDGFVESVVVKQWNDAPVRWNQPVCPLVAGLPKPVGELILERISKAALEAHAPLAGRVCHPNLYVMATDDPDVLVKKSWAHDWHMFGVFDAADAHEPGVEAVGRFMHSQRPIRVWYNTGLSCNGGVSPGAATSTTVTAGYGPPGNASTGMGGFSLSGTAPPSCGGVDTHLIRTSTWSNIRSAVVVIDVRRVKHASIQQMADYVALVGLADVRLNADSVPEPSILQLFGHAPPPQGLSLWDRALLYSLYNTSHWDKLQVSEIESSMVKRIAPQSSEAPGGAR
jgi:hypothetical protein